MHHQIPDTVVCAIRRSRSGRVYSSLLRWSVGKSDQQSRAHSPLDIPPIGSHNGVGYERQLQAPHRG